MAAPERFAEKSDSSCTAGTVHTWAQGCPGIQNTDLAEAAVRDQNRLLQLDLIYLNVV
jgi:hypothetical protein